MQVSRTEGTKRGHPSQELDGLQFAAEAQFQNVPEREFIGRGKRQRLQRGAVTIDSGRSQAAHGKRHLRLRTVRQGVAVRGAQHGVGRTAVVADVALQSHGSGWRTATSPPKTPCSCRTRCRNRRRPSPRRTTACPSDHACRTVTVPAGCAAGHGTIFQHPQNGAVGGRTQHPLPVIIVGRAAHGGQSGSPRTAR